MPAFKSFSVKQLTALNWWCENNPLSSHDAIICDGAIRSGKTLCLSISFISWAFYNFKNSYFAICGKTISSLTRNLITPLIPILSSMGFSFKHSISKNYIDISFSDISNRFYLFGGRDESSASLIQGITLSGILFDEVALMPRSFVEQALARCSVINSKFFFNCNPEHPYHWFFLEWISKASLKNALYLHFTMDDNPSLSASIKKRYASLYSGAFFDRFIRGIWVSAQGLVYDNFDSNIHVLDNLPSSFSSFFLSCDYGITNPFSVGLWGQSNDKFYRIKEFYYDSKIHQKKLTDEEYYNEILSLIGDLPISNFIIDPSASSFIECLNRHGKFKVSKADNNVISGIRKVNDALLANKLFFHSSCKDSIREFALYSYNQNTAFDSVKKENDHAMDDIRYFVSYVLYSSKSHNPFFALSLER